MLVKESIHNVFKPIEPEVGEKLRKIKYLYDKTGQDPYLLMELLLDSGADATVFARLFVKVAPREYLEEYILDNFDDSNAKEEIGNMMEYLSIDNDIFKIISQYAKQENDEEFETLVNDAYNNLDKQMQDSYDS